MRYLLRIAPRSMAADDFLRAVRSVARDTGAEARNPKWTSHGALELDIFAPSKADFETFIAAARPLGTLEFVRDLNQAPPHMSEEELFAEAKRYFNSERYWECHETLETAWRNMSGDEKIYIQGLILVCAAFVHYQKAELEVAMSVLRRALKQLDFDEKSYHGIDVVVLKRQVEHIVSTNKFENFRI